MTNGRRFLLISRNTVSVKSNVIVDNGSDSVSFFYYLLYLQMPGL